MTPILAAAFLCLNPAVHDGDTWRCHDGPRVRAWGIDAPELATPAGPAATRALNRIVAGRTLRCIPKGRSYDRIVAQCFVGRTDVAGEMIRQGQAVDWPRFSKGYYARKAP